MEEKLNPTQAPALRYFTLTLSLEQVSLSHSNPSSALPVRVYFFGSDDEREENLKIVAIAAGAYSQYCS
ncbi:hypothetical protein OROMI_031160 [Orobanche minor]